MLVEQALKVFIGPDDTPVLCKCKDGEQGGCNGKEGRMG